MSNKVITYNLGNSFPGPVMAVGAVLSLSGFISLIIAPIIGIGIFLVGAFFWSSTYGFQYDYQTNKFREYGSVYGFKRGDWKPFEMYPFITILKSRRGTTLYSRSNRSTTLIDDAYEVILLNANHRSKVVVQKYKGLHTAQKFSQQFSTEHQKEIVKFNPAVSEATLKRRRMRRR